MSTAERTSLWQTLFREGPSRGSLTWASAAGVFALYWVYSLVVSPLVVPPSLKGPERGRGGGLDATAQLPNLVLARRHLPHVKWAGDAKYQLRTASAIVYAEEWDPIDGDKAVRFKPFAMIWMQQGKKPGEAPITIVSDSAYVRFTNKFDISKPNPGRVIGGSLEGNVEIRGDNNLQIVGRNFVFSEKAMRMWSDAPLTFAYGPHRGSAHGLQCGLLPTKQPPKGDRLAVGGIETVRLRKNVVMDLVIQPGAGNSNSSRALLERRPESSSVKQKAAERRSSSGTHANAPSKKPTLVNIRSDGAFEFGVQTNVGVFEENVRVTRPTKPGFRDILLCDRLTLVFEPDESKKLSARGSAKSKAKPAAGGERFQTLDSNLAFRRMRAESRDPRRRVVLVSESNRLTAHMDDLIHDAQSKLTVLRDRKSVQVLQESSETHAPQITLLQDQRGTISSLWCDGAGWTRHTDKRTRRVDFTAVWKKRLRKFPDPNSNLDIVDLEQDVVLHQPLETSDLRAQFVRLWMDRREKKPLRAPREKDGGAEKRTRLRRMLALERVLLTSADMRAHTKRLEVWFEHPDERPDGSSTAPQPTAFDPTRRWIAFMASVDSAAVERFSRDSVSLRGGAPGDQPADANPPFTTIADKPGAGARRLVSSSESRPWMGEPRRIRPGSRPNGHGRDAGPMDVWADLIRVRVEMAAREGPKGGGSKVREVWTLGNVEVRQEHEPGEKPLRILGDKMHIVNRAGQAFQTDRAGLAVWNSAGRSGQAGKPDLHSEDQIVHVYGSPGHVYDRMSHIQGDRIHLDRGRNVSWVDGKGLLQLPVDRTLDGRKLARPQLLDVWWRKSMNFDGRTARFRGQVRTVVEDSRIRCEEMDVVLSERVSFINRTGERRAESGRRKREGGKRADVSNSQLSTPSPLTTHETVKVKSVFCRGGVQFESYEYDQSKLAQIRKGNVKSLEVDQATGNSRSAGPGWIEIWRRGQGSSPRFGTPAAVRPNRAAEKSKPSEWNYTKIVFTEGTTGNMKQRHNRFRGHVEVVYGPVERPPHVIDPDNVPRGGGWLRGRDLVVTQQLAANGRPAYFTMAMDGNAEVDGSGFHGRGDTITYDESKDLYILRAVGRRDATIWRQLRVGAEPDRADAKRMQYEPSINRLKLDQTSTVQGLR